ncbi:putative poly(A)-specific ribonuclease [Helianthus annuus]|nr:putative poly(A)-specific ribonuclease [Helianthus annuus]
MNLFLLIFICAFTHVNVQQDLKDVKLWQVYTMLKGLENIAASADIPMLVCGDFSSVPGRILIVKTGLQCSSCAFSNWEVDPLHPDLAVDPLGILRPTTKLTHTLPLVI